LIKGIGRRKKATGERGSFGEGEKVLSPLRLKATDMQEREESASEGGTETLGEKPNSSWGGSAAQGKSIEARSSSNAYFAGGSIPKREAQHEL